MKSNKKGMSFVEMLVVLTIMAIVSVSIYGMLVAGINIWKRTLDINLEEDARIFFDKVRIDIAKYVPFESLDFEANETSLGFSFIEKLPYNAPWAKNRDDTLVTQIAYVNYIYIKSQDRVEKHVRDMFTKKTDIKIVFRNVRKFTMTYFFKNSEGKIIEKEKLNDKQKPQMIKIDIQYGDKFHPQKTVEIINFPFML